jgi:hypothetical protein
MAQLPGEAHRALTLARTAEREAARTGLVLSGAKAQQIRAELSLVGEDLEGARIAAAQAWPVLRRSGARPWIMRCVSVMRTTSPPAVGSSERVAVACGAV